MPLVQEKWEFQPQLVEFSKDNGLQTLKLLPRAGKAVLKDFIFSTGTIEFDILTKDKTFAFLYFRYKNAVETECFYFRTFGAGKPYATDAVQYTPYLSGVNMWDVMGHYQSKASIKNGEWNHVKMEVSKSQMRLYVNNETKPTLEVPLLEGNTSSGTIAFEGEMQISNLTVSHADVAGLSHSPGIDPTDYEPRFIRKWMVSNPITTPKKVDFSYDFLPVDSTQWKNLEAERRGFVNLTRKFGKSENRRIVWLKVVMKADQEQKRKMDIGFSDEVWVFLNGRMVYLDKNPYNQPMMKEPNGRISIENASFDLPLIEGYNDLLIGVANDFYGWGIMARMDQLEGIELINDSSLYYNGKKVVKLSDQVLNHYTGNYKQSDGKAFSIIKEDNGLKLTGEGLPPYLFLPEAEGKFFLKEFDLQMVLFEDEAKNVSTVKFFQAGDEVMKMEVKKQ